MGSTATGTRFSRSQSSLFSMLSGPILGHATITVVNRAMTYAIGVAMCIVLYYGFQHVNWSYGWSHTLAGTNKFSTSSSRS